MTTIAFGTDGIRTEVGLSPFTAKDLPQLGRALALWIQQKYGRNATVIIAHDTRISCSWFKATLKSGLLLYPIRLFDAGVLPSPAIMSLMHHQSEIDFDCGLIISASHNHYLDNGIKIIDSRSGKISAQDEDDIIQFFKQEHTISDYLMLGTDSMWSGASLYYIDAFKKFFASNFLKNKTIVLDCANGAASFIAPALFTMFGAQTITINAQPNGMNINKQCGALHLTSLQQAVIEHGADAGFAFDGDADRVMAVNKYGQIKNGDDILALLLDHPRYASTTSIVGTVMTNQGFEVYLQNRAISLLRTPVGDKHISQELIQRNSLLGGEQSGHIITRDYLNTGDGIFIALRTLESLLIHDNWDMKTFIKFPQIIINIPIQQKKDLTTSPIIDLINSSINQLLNGRIIVRYSGTESLLRIMIEDTDYDHAQSIGTKLSERLQQALV